MTTELAAQAKIERLAAFIGKKIFKKQDIDFVTGEPRIWFIDENEFWWNPLTDWNHWRQVEEKVMEDEKLLERYVHKVCLFCHAHGLSTVMRPDLPERVDALLSALNSHEAR